ncbi:MAG: hypothetical protein ABI229_01355 [Gemmatimonadaceae bacterium]
MKYRLLGACAAVFCCAAPVFAQGLSRVELLGLQQQLRDDGCGVTHITGRMDAMTRSAVKKCESKYSGATDARSMLAAMHIGFENGNPDPTMAMANSGGMSSTMTDSMGHHMRRGMKRMMKDSTGRMMRHDRMRDSSTMSHDSSNMMMKHKMMKKNGMMSKHDTTPETH